MSIRSLSGLILPLLFCAHVAPAAEPRTAQLVPTPRAKVLPVSATNRPFLAAAQAGQPVPLATNGYVESELVVSGFSNIQDWTGEPRDAAVAVRAATVPYSTRVLVRRPQDAAKFSGLVVVELLNPTGLYDFAPLWGFSWNHFLRRGDVWVGVTVKPVAAATLRRFDPVRYAALDFSYRQPPECLPPKDARADSPDTENGLAWDLIGQVGALLRSSSKENPLLDLKLRHVVLAGYSQTGSYVVNYANAMHRLLRLGSGAPVYDGYLNAAGSRAIALNQCAEPPADEDPRRVVMPREVPFVTVMTESDFDRAPAARRPDGEAPGDFYRLYEIAGAAHSGPFPAGMPAARDLAIAGHEAPPADLCVEPRGDFPVGLAFNAIWQQYDEMLQAGQPMAPGARILLDESGAPLRDANGNAVGGWRLPQLDLPLARYGGRSTPRDNSARAASVCALTGTREPLAAARLKALYTSRAEYLKRFGEAVDLAVQERRLVKEDGESLKGRGPGALPQF